MYITALEAQLENEHEERTLLLREKHELERRLNDAEERGRHHRAADEDALLRLRRDLKKTKALLRDAQMMLERTKQDSPSKAALRALKNQVSLRRMPCSRITIKLKRLFSWKTRSSRGLQQLRRSSRWNRN